MVSIVSHRADPKIYFLYLARILNGKAHGSRNSHVHQYENCAFRLAHSIQVLPQCTVASQRPCLLCKENTWTESVGRSVNSFDCLIPRAATRCSQRYIYTQAYKESVIISSRLCLVSKDFTDTNWE
jgi:hypothetical protein